MTRVPDNERALIAEVYRDLAAVLNRLVVRDRSVDRIKVATAAMSITSAWILKGVAESDDALRIAEEAFVRSLKLNLQRPDRPQATEERMQ